MNCNKAFIFFCLTAAISSCSHSPSASDKKRRSPLSEISYAERFTLEKKDGISILTIIDPWQGAVNVNQVYYLVKRGETIPQGYDTSRVIRTPVSRIIAMSTTYLSMISALGETDKVTGISGADLLYDEKLRKAVNAGKIEDVGYNENLNGELIVKLDPDLVMVYGIGGESSGYTGKLKELGIKVMFNADYLENDPLGKAEWIKVFGALFLKEKEANELFSSIVDEYNSIKKFISEKTSARPSVLLGLPWKDTWYVSPGNSFISRLISDAGGNYIWKETTAEASMPYGLESVWRKAMNADYWLNISNVQEPGEILTIDNRLGEIPAFKKGNLYNNNNRVADNGGNDYWESGSVNPQIILKDVASILHPEIFPDYICYYYRKIR
ncbi:MAG: ABC transporter substrate-binding protein [Bacteroidales bacterium]|jgi:iron complex transport system substrate-binding protein